MYNNYTRVRNIIKIPTNIFKNNLNMKIKQANILPMEEMPRPISLPIFGTKLQLLIAGGGNRLHEYIDKRHKQLGPVFQENLESNSALVFISNPTLMKHLFLNLEGKYPAHILPEPWKIYEKLYGQKRGLFFMDGEDWLLNRRITNKHLLKEDSDKWLENPVRIVTKQFVEKWKHNTSGKAFVPNLDADFYKFSINVIIGVLIGDCDNIQVKPDKHNEYLLTLFSESVKKIFETTTALFGLPLGIYQKYNLKKWRDFKESVDMSLLLAKKIIPEIMNRNKNHNGLIKRLSDENLSNDLITKIAADFIIAAGDTTAYTSTWALYLISKNQDAINYMRKDKNYVKFVLKEVMRLYPVAPFLTRILPKDGVLDHYALKAGTPVIASIYTSGRDECYFSKADKFLPYRWDRNDPRKAELVKHEPSASMPFAFGARSCIGKKLAVLQITELIYQIVNEFDIKCKNDSEVKALTCQVLVPDKNIEILLTPRKYV